MTKTFYKMLLDKSISAAVSAIELYNKPDFKYREDSFVILIVNSWELLLKAKVLKENNDSIESLYILNKKTGKFKHNRTGSFMTLDIKNLLTHIDTNLNSVVIDNLTKLIELRDNSIHFVNDEDIKYIINALGVANIKNYELLVRNWFNKSLVDYNFYVLPLSFNYDFKSIKLLNDDTGNKDNDVFIKSLKSSKNEEKGFYLSYEIKAVLKKDLNINNESIPIKYTSQEKDAHLVYEKEIDPIIKYPLSYTQLRTKIKKIYPAIKQPQFNEFLKPLKVNKDYAYHHFRNQKQRDKFEKTGEKPKSITVSYNDRALNYLKSKCEEYLQ